MARVWYVDHQSGSANSSGDSLAITQSGADATISGTSLSIPGGGLTGKTGRTISVNTTGSTYKVYTIASVQTDTTATLSALDVLANCGPVQYYIGGAWKGFASVTSLRVLAGDTVRCKKSPDPTSLGQAAQWTQAPTAGNNAVVLTTAVTQALDACDSGWSGGTNVTQSNGSTYKEGTACQKFVTGAGFTTGVLGSKSITLVDCSAYEQICFWFQASTTAINAGDIELRLQNGSTVRQTISIPAIPQVALWQPIVVDLGAALGSDIDTLVLYVNNAQTSKTFLIDNIFAAKASSSPDALTLNSLLSKSSLAQGAVDSEGWYAIDSITGTSILLRRSQNAAHTSAFPGYSGATESVTTYKREAFICTATETFSLPVGSSGSYVSLEGGWDATDMSTQTGETWLNFNTSSANNGISFGAGFHSINRFGVVGGATGINLASSYGRATNLSAASCNGSGILVASGSMYNIDNLHVVGGGANGVAFSSGGHMTVGTVRGDSTVLNGISITGSNFKIATAKANNNLGVGIQLGPGVAEVGGSTSLNSAGGLNAPTTGSAYLRNFTVNEAVVVGFGTVLANISVAIENYGGVSGATRYYSDSWLAQTDTTVKHGAVATQSWKLQPQSATVRIAEYPGRLPLAQIAVNANTTYTVTGWFARNNSGISVKLAVPGGQLAGLSASDQSTPVTVTPATILGATHATPIVVNVTGHGYADGDPVVIDGVGGNTAANGSSYAHVVDADHFSLYSDAALSTPIAGNGDYTSGGTVCAWQQVSVVFTPTENGVVLIEAQAYGGATYSAWVSDLGVSG